MATSTAADKKKKKRFHSRTTRDVCNMMAFPQTHNPLRPLATTIVEDAWLSTPLSHSKSVRQTIKGAARPRKLAVHFVTFRVVCLTQGVGCRGYWRGLMKQKNGITLLSHANNKCAWCPNIFINFRR